MFAGLSRREYTLLVIILLAACAIVSFIYDRYAVRGKWSAVRSRIPGMSLYLYLNAAILHFFYITYTRTFERQHDVIGFRNEKGIGQAALIEYLMENGRLPDFDPTKRWGFFQPLLHHITAAVLLKINLIRGMNYDRACETIQILTFIYSMIFILYGFRILRLMDLKGKGLHIAEALIAFHPLLTLLSGSVNNDMMSHMFLIMAVYYGLKWYKTDSITDLCLTALVTGLSMMAKLSGILVSPAIAFLMVNKLYTCIKEKGNILNRFIQYIIFGVIVFPLGLFFPLRNLILFNVPVTYMPDVGEELTGYSILSRIFDIRTDTPFACMVKNGDPYDEYNVFLGLIKTSLTGEYDLAAVNGKITIFAWILFISGVVLFIVDMILFIRIFSGNDIIKSVPIRVFWVILILTGVLFMLRLVFTVPNFSSQDSRYIAWIIVPAALLPGLYATYKPEGKEEMLLIACTAVFCISSAAVYYILGMP